MNTDKERLDFWNANSLLEIGYSAKMGGDGAGWYWQLGTNRRSGIKNVRDTLDSAMAQLKKPKQVAQDVARGAFWIMGGSKAFLNTSLLKTHV